MKKATLAIYPESSIRDRKKNSTTTIGKKLRTEPTPLKMPSMTRLCSAVLTPAAVRALSTRPDSLSSP